jgi:predicted ATPase
MVPGIGIAVLIGTGVFLRTRSLLGDSKEKKEKQLAAVRQRKAQLVIKNLQETISELVERLAYLEKKVKQLETNQEAIGTLRKRLTMLKCILDQKKQRLAVT